MKQYLRNTLTLVACAVALSSLCACSTQQPAASASDIYLAEFAPGEFRPLSIEERLEVLAELCPKATRPYCRIGPNRKQCTCVDDDQMRRNLEAFRQQAGRRW